MQNLNFILNLININFIDGTNRVFINKQMLIIMFLMSYLHKIKRPVCLTHIKTLQIKNIVTNVIYFNYGIP